MGRCKRRTRPAVSSPAHEMLPKAMKSAAMKSAAARPMTKGALAKALATGNQLKPAVCSKIINSLGSIVTKEVVKTGVFSLPGLFRIKTRVKPAKKAGQRQMFGKLVQVKAQPAKKVVKAFPAAALKKTV